MTRSRPAWLRPLAFLAFVSLGLPDGVLGVAWPFMRRSFGRPLDHLGIVLMLVMIGYLCSSFSAGTLVARMGIGRLLLVSSVLVAASSALWALTPLWLLVPAGALLAGLGAGAIDAGINAFAATRWSPRVVTWMHGSWGLGAMLGPLIMVQSVARGFTWRGGYALLAAVLLLMATLFWVTQAQWEESRPPAVPGVSRSARMGEALQRRAVRRHALLFFLYTGIEASAGGWAFSLLTESRHMDAELAGVATSCYWGSLWAGRLLFGVAARHVDSSKLLRAGMAGIPLAALALSLASSAELSIAALVTLGLTLAPIFPLLIAETPSRVGERHAEHAIGFQVSAATLGAGSLGACVGVVARHASLEVLGPCLLALGLMLLVLHEGGSKRAPARAESATVGRFS
jgi:fucose permease